MFPPAATDISGFGGGRGRERPGPTLNPQQVCFRSKASPPPTRPPLALRHEDGR